MTSPSFYPVSCKYEMLIITVFLLAPGRSLKLLRSLLYDLLLATSWWFQPIWKICSSNWKSSRNRDENSKNVWNHHPKSSILIDYSVFHYKPSILGRQIPYFWFNNHFKPSRVSELSSTKFPPLPRIGLLLSADHIFEPSWATKTSNET